MKTIQLKLIDYRSYNFELMDGFVQVTFHAYICVHVDAFGVYIIQIVKR